MAKRTIEKYYSDISGEEIESGNPTLTFSFDGITYRIDVTKDEKTQIKEALSPYIKAARKVSASAGRRRGRSSGASAGSDAKNVRAWAREQGIDVPARGRIPSQVLEAYNAAH